MSSHCMAISPYPPTPSHSHTVTRMSHTSNITHHTPVGVHALSDLTVQVGLLQYTQPHVRHTCQTCSATTAGGLLMPTAPGVCGRYGPTHACHFMFSERVSKHSRIHSKGPSRWVNKSVTTSPPPPPRPPPLQPVVIGHGPPPSAHIPHEVMSHIPHCPPARPWPPPLASLPPPTPPPPSLRLTPWGYGLRQ